MKKFFRGLTCPVQLLHSTDVKNSCHAALEFFVSLNFKKKIILKSISIMVKWWVVLVLVMVQMDKEETLI